MRLLCYLSVIVGCWTIVCRLVGCWYLFFFNGTATTYIYTYLHTLSLRDALPFCCRRDSPHRRNSRRRRPGHSRAAAPCAPGRVAPVHRRSEEHTSALQSLMRNSYAVFCLKK